MPPTTNKSGSITINPSSITGSVTAPSSKSYTHRAIICASLAPGVSHIHNPLESADIRETKRTIEALGARIVKQNGTLIVEGTENLTGEKLVQVCEDDKILEIKTLVHSGSSLRFLIPIAAVTKTKYPIFFMRKGRLKERPIEPLLDVLNELGVKCKIEKIDDNRDAVVIYPRPRKNIGEINHIGKRKIRMPGDISSQFITGLLFVLPRAPKVTLTIENLNPESKPYIELTLDVLKRFGIEIKASKGLDEFTIKPNQHYIPTEFTIEGDYSSGAFLLAAGAISGNIEVDNLNPKSKQSDRAIVKILKRMGAKINLGKRSVSSKKSKLKGIRINLKDTPDLGPICATLGCFAEGKTTITGAEKLRVKESDRLSAITEELTKMGANIEEKRDGLIVHGVPELKGAIIDPHNDHRIAMACAVAALGAKGKTTIKNPKCVEKSYPNFFKDLKNLGAQVSQVKSKTSAHA
ncbi:MAG: 3-phosphoshikimate 1-carboxyvinyltransferase [Methanobacteriota archaeon]